MSGGRDRGELAIVLHTHMPYVEGFGTWPFGEEWLWEAIAGVYLPLLDMLERDPPLTLSLTPVLCDQLEAPGTGERLLAFLRDVRGESHRLDIEGLRDTGHPELADELVLSARDYERAIDRFDALGGDLLAALAPHAAWTSAATHAVLPLLATDAGVSAQLEAGIASHRARAGDWNGGLWLPECAHAPWLDPLLAAAGVRATCVELTNVFGRGDARNLLPIATGHGPTLVPLDRATIDLVWSDDGYPADGAYRDYHHHTVHHHRPWANDGARYDRERAAARVREHARDFVTRTIARLDQASAELGRPALAVCALDTELLGHWWYEGLAWLEAVFEEAAAAGLAVASLDDALERHEPVPAPAAPLPATTWGQDGDLSTWDGRAVSDLAIAARDAELRAVAAGAGLGDQAVRELLALQSSDWAFMVSRDLAVDYARGRASDHLAEFDAAIAAVGSREARLRNLAPYATPSPFLRP